jgi:hypothetical protein
MYDSQPSFFDEPGEANGEAREPAIEDVAEVFKLAREYLDLRDPGGDLPDEVLPPALASMRRRRLEKAKELGLVAKWADYSKAKGCVSIHDPDTGRWHGLPWKDAPSWARWEAIKRSEIYRATGDAAAFDLTADQMRKIWEKECPPEEGIVEEYELPDD